MTVTTEVQKLEPDNMVELYQLDLVPLGGEMLYFHAMTQVGPIWWDGQQYDPWPIKAEGFGRTSDKQPTPKLTVANLQGGISALCLLYDDLVGAVLRRIRTFAQFLDARNFPGPTLLTNGGFDTDDVGGWLIPSGTADWDSATKAMRLGNDAAETRLFHSMATTVGQTYTVRFTVDNELVTSRIGTSAGADDLVASGAAEAGFNERTFVATTTITFLEFRKAAGVTRSLLDSVYAGLQGVNPTEDATQQLPPEVWYVERKASENNQMVQFEMASAFDLQGVMLPRRTIIANYCSWKSMGGYRGPYCGYAGPAVAKADGTPTTVLAEDQCGGKISDCKLRDWPDDVLNFGGFPAAGLIRT